MASFRTFPLIDFVRCISPLYYWFEISDDS